MLQSSPISFFSTIQLLEKRNKLHNRQDKIMARLETINWMCSKIKCKFTDSISDIDVAAEAKLPLIPHFVHVPHAADPRTAKHCTFVFTSKSELTFSFSNKKQPIFSTAKSVHLILTPIRSFFYWPLNGNQLNSWAKQKPYSNGTAFFLKLLCTENNCKGKQPEIVFFFLMLLTKNAYPLSGLKKEAACGYTCIVETKSGRQHYVLKTLKIIT